MAEPLPELTEQQKIRLLRIARESVFHFVTRDKVPVVQESDPRLHEKQGVFVSLHQGDRLRGCIGTFQSDEPLYKTVVDIAIGAATRDPRFSPLRTDEVPRTEFELSVLSRLEVVAPEDVEVGKHGLLITVGRNRGTLLPQVASQFGWEREEFLEQTCVKAGLPRDAWKDPAARIEVFAAAVFSESQMRRRR